MAARKFVKSMAWTADGWLTNPMPTADFILSTDLPDISATYLTVATAASTYAPLASPALTGTPTAPTAGSTDNSTKIATTAFVQTVVSAAVAGLLEFKGNINCSANPNYPAALKGDTYYVSVAGRIGGASGPLVDVGDAVIASADNAGGDQATVGGSWFILEHNIAGVLLAANNLSDVANAATARTNLGLGSSAVVALDTDGLLTANSDTRIASQKATKTYADAAKTAAVSLALVNNTFKIPVRVVATANVAYTAGVAIGQVIDGVTLVSGDRVLLTAQTTAFQNVILTAGSGAGNQAVDYPLGGTILSSGLIVEVMEGTVNAGTFWRMTNTGAVIPGTTSVTWAKFMAGLGANTFSGTQEIYNSFPYYSLRCNGVGASPLGQWRWVVGADGHIYLQENTSAGYDYGTANTAMRVESGNVSIHCYIPVYADVGVHTDKSNPAAVGVGISLYVGSGTVAASQYVQQRVIYQGVAGVTSYMQWMFGGGGGTQMATLDRYGSMNLSGWLGTGQYIVAPVSARNTNAVGSSVGNNQILKTESGNTGNDVRKLAYLVRDTAGSDWQGVTYQDGIDVDNVWSVPGNASTLRSWIKRKPLTGSVTIGDQAGDLIRTDATNGTYLYSGSFSTLTLWSVNGRGAEAGFVDNHTGTPYARYIRMLNTNFEFVNNAYSLVTHSLGNTGDITWVGVAAGSGASITSLNASNLASGTVPVARLTTNLQTVSNAAGATNTYLGYSSSTVVAWTQVDRLNIAPHTATGQQPFRLTLETGVPVSTSDQTAKSTLYLTRFKGGLMEVPNFGAGGALEFYELTTDASLALSGLTSGKNYDVFLYMNGATPTLELGPAWTNDTTRAAAGLLTWQNGVLCKTGDPIRMWVGTIRATGTTTTEDSAQQRFVYNAFNKVRRKLRYSPGATGTNTTTTFYVRSTNDQVRWVAGDVDHTVSAFWRCRLYGATAAQWAAIALDNTTPTNVAAEVVGTGSSYQDSTSNVYYEDNPGIGYHYLQGVLNGNAGGNFDLSQPGYGFVGSIFC